MRRYFFPKPYADRVQRLRVPFGFFLVAAFAGLSHPTQLSLAWGLPVALCGVALRAWAAGHLAKNQQLARSGPYAWTRNPLYLGTALTALGLVLAGRSFILGALFLAAFLLVYLPAIELEEQHLRTLFPEYPAYAAQVPLLVPRFPPARSIARFRISLYLKNQEYQALLGFLLGAGFLVWKWRAF